MLPDNAKVIRAYFNKRDNTVLVWYLCPDDLSKPMPMPMTRADWDAGQYAEETPPKRYIPAKVRDKTSWQPCACCGSDPRETHVMSECDHRHPFSAWLTYRDASGILMDINGEENIQPMCKPCNSSKNNRGSCRLAHSY